MKAKKDRSLDYLKRLLKKGFNKVKWVYPDSGCKKCKRLNGKKWDLEEFIEGLEYKAPIFEHSHVNCNCYLEVSNDDGEVLELNWKGLL
jgi:hypothetical protein